MFYTIKNDNLEIVINSLGAEITSVKYKGIERTWQNDSGEWEDHSPVLFPYCGHFSVDVFGRHFKDGFHGVVTDANFAVIERADDSIRFSTCSSKNTKNFYPFDFIFDVVYTLEEDGIKVDYEISNPTDYELFFACGSHDSFYTFDNLLNCSLKFEKEEELLRLYADDNGYLTGEEEKLDKTDTFIFPNDRRQFDLSIIFKGVKSNSVTLLNGKGKKICKIEFSKEVNNILLWASLNGEYICIEPWSNLPDKANCERKEMAQKYGVMELSPKEKKRITRRVTYY